MQCLICGAGAPNTAQNCPACGSPLGAQTLAVGTILHGKYRIEDVLGQGGFGITYGVTQTVLGSKLAIKEMFPMGTLRQGKTVHPPTTFDPAGWQQAKKDFTEEARVLARFNHPDIVRVLDLFEEGGTAYMVMERLDGESLQTRLDRLGALPAAQVETIAVRMTQALRLVHSAGLLHRDLKPDNIFLETSGRIVLIDFGSARVYTSGKTVSHTRLVTAGYAPPEQYGSSARFGPYTDIYSLGATLYQTLTGQMPPASTDLMLGTPLPPLPATVPGSLRHAIEKMMAIRVTDRPQDAEAVLDLLGSVPIPIPQSAPGQAAKAPLPSPALPTQPTKTPLHKRSVWPLITFALLAAGGYKQFFSHSAEASTRPSSEATAPTPTPTSAAATEAESGDIPAGDTAATQNTETEAAQTAPASPEIPFTITNPAADTTLPAGGFDLEGTGTANETVKILQDGISLGQADIDGNGSWRMSVPSPTAGEHIYSVRGADGTELGTIALSTAKIAPTIPAEEPMTDDEVQTLVDQYLDAGRQEDVTPAMNLYAARVDYFDRGFQPRSVLYDDKHNYFVRWPSRNYQRTSGITTLADQGNTRQVRFDYSYDILRPDKEVSGTAYTVLDLVKENGTLLIEGEKGAIYPKTQVKRTISQPRATANATSEATAPSADLSSDSAQSPASSPQISGAPTFPQWYFTTCADTETGQQQTGLMLGHLQNCSLVIETVPNGAHPTSADFSYELEYPENAAIQKFALDTPDHWPPTPQQPTTTLQTDGNNLIFTLPLAVRERPDRRYTSINVIGKITFDNGGTKQIYEKLPIN